MTLFQSQHPNPQTGVRCNGLVAAFAIIALAVVAKRKVYSF